MSAGRAVLGSGAWLCRAGVHSQGAAVSGTGLGDSSNVHAQLNFQESRSVHQPLKELLGAQRHVRAALTLREFAQERRQSHRHSDDRWCRIQFETGEHKGRRRKS